MTSLRLSLAAAALAWVAALVSALDGLREETTFFLVALALATGQAWAVGAPGFVRRGIAIGVAAIWVVAAVWIDVLLLSYLGSDVDLSVPPGPEATYLGLTATVYHLVALHGGLVLVALSARLADRRSVGRTLSDEARSGR